MTSRRWTMANAANRNHKRAAAPFTGVFIPFTTLLVALSSGSASGIENSRTLPGPLDSHREYRLPSEAVRPILLAQVSLAVEPASVSARGPAARTAAAHSIDQSLIDTLTRMPPPSYVSPVGSISPGWNFGFGAVRSGKLVPHIEAVAPSDHTGLSFSSAPRLWWRLDSKTEHPIQVTIVDENSLDPLFRIDLAGPHEAGLDAINLSQHGVELKPGIDYRWFVTLVLDPERPSRNPLSEGAIRVLAQSDSRRADVAKAPLPTHGHRLAQLGIWYDAYDFFSELAAKNPDAIVVVRDRDRLTQTVLSE